jgi:tRNA(Ile)-lysidine synthase
MCTRASGNLRIDDEYICSVADEFVRSHVEITNNELISLHEAVFARVLFRMCNVSLSYTNLKEIRALLVKNDFSYSLPGGKVFISEKGVCSVRDSKENSDIDYCLEIKQGINVFDNFSSMVILSNKKIDKTSLKIYKLSTQVVLSSAIIEGDLHIRPRREGDSLYFGGITRKLKKVFCDKKIPKSKRSLVPILCDNRGPVYVPGLGVRDDGGKNEIFVAFGVGNDEDSTNPRFYFANEFVK